MTWSPPYLYTTIFVKTTVKNHNAKCTLFFKYFLSIWIVLYYFIIQAGHAEWESDREHKIVQQQQRDQIWHKFCHFGNNSQVFGKILTVFFLFGKMLTLLWQIGNIIRLIFIVFNGSMLKNNQTIWSHCSRSNAKHIFIF